MVQFEVWHLVVGAVLTSKPTISTDSEAVCSDPTECLIMTSFFVQEVYIFFIFRGQRITFRASVHLIFKSYPMPLVRLAGD